MANSPQSRKRARQAETRRRRNVAKRSRMRTYIKKVQAAVAEGNAEGAEAALKDATPIIDRMATKGILHKNKAARHKSRLSAQIRALQGGSQTIGG